MAGTLSVCLPISVSTVSPRTTDKSSSSRRSTVVTFRQTHGFLWRFAAKSPQFSRPFSVICAGKSPEDFSNQDGKDEEGQFVAPRVTPDYVAKDSVKPPSRVVKNLEGPWITRKQFLRASDGRATKVLQMDWVVNEEVLKWGGNVRGGKYQMGQGTDRIIDIFANGDAMLIAAGGLIVLFLLLLQFRPDAPPPPPPS